jgi:hypothetical protein
LFETLPANRISLSSRLLSFCCHFQLHSDHGSTRISIYCRWWGY